MGFKGKIVFLMIVYFAGFATAIYYLAPSDATAQDQGQYYGGYSQKQTSAKNGGIIDKIFEKTYAKASGAFEGMSSDEVKEKFSLGFQKLIEMSRNNPNKEDP